MSFEVQNQIRQNATDIRSYLDDLFTWEEEIGNKKSKRPQDNSKKEFSIRGNVENREKNRQSSKNFDTAKLKRDTNSVVDYYREWDKFDVVRLKRIFCNVRMLNCQRKIWTNLK